MQYPGLKNVSHKPGNYFNVVGPMFRKNKPLISTNKDAFGKKFARGYSVTSATISTRARFPITQFLGEDSFLLILNK